MKLTNLIQKDLSNEHHAAFLTDVVNGLNGEQKSISAKYFYDDVGSKLFQKISQHPDYYPTKTEFSILNAISGTLPTVIKDAEIDIIELGAGDGHKSELIINGFIAAGRKVNFYPIDISEKAMQLLGENLSVNNQLNIHGVVADYLHGLSHLKTISSNRKLLLFLGSNIGNFNKAQTSEFLGMLSHGLNAEDYALIGFDLKKDPAILNKAYNDSDGLTQAFNLNLLTRINRELGGNFDLAKYKHYGFYNPYRGTMESYLIALEQQTVHIEASNQTFNFNQFESMHLEYSHKFTASGIHKLAERNGFSVTQLYADEKNYFIDALWQVNQLG